MITVKLIYANVVLHFFFDCHNMITRMSNNGDDNNNVITMEYTYCQVQGITSELFTLSLYVTIHLVQINMLMVS